MTAPVLTFFNNKGGVGKTSLIYHLAWMFARLGRGVVVLDLDPQANLTAAFLDEDHIEALWNAEGAGSTIYQCVSPLAGVADIAPPLLQPMAENLHLLPGDIRLSGFEEALSKEWPDSMGDSNLYRPMRILSAFWQVMQMAGDQVQAEILLADIGPNLGAINRSVLLATDYVAIPLGADLFSLQGLSNLGPTLRSWKNLWQKRLNNWEESPEKRHYPDFRLPSGKMQPIGYLCQQHGVLLERPVKAYDKWVQRIPAVYREAVLNEAPVQNLRQEDDPFCLATIRHYRSLVPMAQERRKPIFNLTSADGAIGSHAHAVSDARRDFRILAEKIAEKTGLAPAPKPWHP
ncbi:ParA family protein [Desulfobotulus mexicanus]|uniref:AAA family ATPase n=1 Tax=Desulfobotulus mexicanus TaxID=2586642 RepID=A0A5Q4VCJ3_9BACT|nr:AAA family ATPase [Desulfobotulus mexicanus]TYT74688.1 AAA family ATPase [Desulfobotulus mexicanus]